MTERRFDIAILGLGAMGSAAAAECAARGADVVGFEQFDFAHDRSSSHGESRIVRLAYFEHPDYVPLLRRALAGWLRLNAASNRPLFHPCGGLWLGEPDHPMIAGSRRAARTHGLAYELLDADAVEDRFAPLQVPRGHIGFHESLAGAARPERTVRHLIARASADRAILHERTAVHGWHHEVGGFAIETDRGHIRASRLIVTAGPWTARLLRNLGVPLVVTRQTTAWFDVEREPDRFHPARFPCWALARDASSFFYGFPVLSNPPSLKVSIHAPMSPVDPDCVDQTLQRHEVDELRHGLSTILPEMGAAGLARTSVCLYTNTPDGHFVIDVLEDDPRVVVACGFSGHGFKFTPVVGEILADLALDGGTKLPIAFLSRRRFPVAPA